MKSMSKIHVNFEGKFELHFILVQSKRLVYQACNPDRDVNIISERKICKK
jgi:hypothetical protein